MGGYKNMHRSQQTIKLVSTCQRKLNTPLHWSVVLGNRYVTRDVFTRRITAPVLPEMYENEQGYAHGRQLVVHASPALATADSRYCYEGQWRRAAGSSDAVFCCRRCCSWPAAIYEKTHSTA